MKFQIRTAYRNEMQCLNMNCYYHCKQYRPYKKNSMSEKNYLNKSNFLAYKINKDRELYTRRCFIIRKLDLSRIQEDEKQKKHE